MNTTLLNNRTKFGAKIYKPYRVITFLMLGHFFSRTLYIFENYFAYRVAYCQRRGN